MSDIHSQPTVHQPPREDPLAPDLVAESFPQLEVMEVLGRGGMGVVYKARHKDLDRLVALKIMPPETGRDGSFAERFGREARALAKLQHPNIVMVFDSGHVDDLYYFIMEYVDGTNLRELMNGGRLDPAKAMSIVPPVCEALQYAHDEGVVHRDIKPENILLDQRGRVKIADFGIAKLVTGRTREMTLTNPQQVLGTINYMAPEQIEHSREVDHRADIYALGVVFYEVLTGELPIGRFPLPSEKTPLDHRLDEVVLHALEKEPEKRYQRIDEVGTEVKRISGVWDAGGPAAAWEAPAGAPAAAPYAPAPGATVGAPAIPFPSMREPGWGYLCWLLCFFGLCGMHRIYARRYITGVLWFLTGGFFMIGQFVDLFLIPGMIKLSNLQAAFQHQQTMAMLEAQQPAPPRPRTSHG